MPPSVENIAAQAQPQDLQYVDMGYYDRANDYPSLPGHRDHIFADDARIVQDVPAQAHVAPPAPVCTTARYRIHISNHTLHHLQRRLTHLTTKFSRLRPAPLQPSSTKFLTRTLSPMGSGPLKSFGNSQLSTCTTPIHKLLGFVWNPAMPME
jgi:hypothetical protein